MSITAMKQALEALERYSGVDQRACDAEEALCQAIEQAEKQPPYINFSNDRITIDPNTGNVGIGTPVKQEQAEQVGPTQSPYYMLNPKADQRPIEQAEKAEPVAWKQTIRSLTEQCFALVRERDELQKQVWLYEKNGVTCQTYRHTVEQSCSECNVQMTYTHPAREWVGLTGLEQKELMAMPARDAVFAAEAKLKEKNQ